MPAIDVHFRYPIHTRDRRPRSRLEKNWCNSAITIELAQISAEIAPVAALIGQANTPFESYSFQKPDFRYLPSGQRRELRTIGDQHYIEFGSLDHLQKMLTETDPVSPRPRLAPTWLGPTKEEIPAEMIKTTAYRYREIIDHHDVFVDKIRSELANYVLIDGRVFEPCPEPILTSHVEYQRPPIIYVTAYDEAKPFATSQQGFVPEMMGDRLTESDRFVNTVTANLSDVQILADFEIIDASKFTVSPTTKSAKTELVGLLKNIVSMAASLPTELGYAVLQLRDAATASEMDEHLRPQITLDIIEALEKIALTELPSRDATRLQVLADPRAYRLHHVLPGTDEQVNHRSKTWGQYQRSAAGIAAAARLDLDIDNSFNYTP